MNLIHRAAVATVIISNLSLQVALTTAAHAEERPDRELSNVRLTGVVIQPDRQLAIFAVTGAGRWWRTATARFTVQQWSNLFARCSPN